MKKLLVVGMVAMLTTATLGATAVNAAPGRHRHHDQYTESNNAQLKEDCRFVLRRTNKVLRRSQALVREQMGRRHSRRHSYQMGRSGLGYAITFQMKAGELYRQGYYQPAIDYSLRARAIALRVIRRIDQGQIGLANGYDEFKSCDMDRDEMDSRESRYWDRRPDGNQLEIEVRGNEIDDEDAVSFNLEFNF